MLKGAQCTLPYPDRFQVASQYVHAQETEGRSISRVLVHCPVAECASQLSQAVLYCAAGKLSLKDDPRLALYALHQQAVKGPCRDPKPW